MEIMDVIKIIDNEITRLKHERLWTDYQSTVNEAEINACKRIKLLVVNAALGECDFFLRMKKQEQNISLPLGMGRDPGGN